MICDRANLLIERNDSEENSDRAYLLFEFSILPEQHASFQSDSWEDRAFYVREGKVSFELDDWTIVATSGTILHALKGQMHKFTNIGSESVKMLCWVLPDGVEDFFARVGATVENLSIPIASIDPEDIKKLLATVPGCG